MAESKHYLVSFENVSASVGGFDISSIVELSLSAAANDAPRLTLLVDAGHSNGGKPEAVAAVSLDNAREIFDNCRSLVKKDGATLSLSLTCHAVGPGGEDTQSLNLSGWLLADVSLSPIQESGVCTVALTFRHPICKADLGGTIPGLLAAPPSFDGLSGSNPLEVFVSALQLYGEEAQRVVPRPVSVAGAADTSTVRDRLLSHLAKATSCLESSVSWVGGGLPAESLLGGWGDLLRKGLTCYALPSRGTSVFQRFAKMLVPECSLALGGDYTSEKLELKPFEPWASASLTIQDSDIISLQFPQDDPTPISGVQIVSTNTADGAPCSHHVDTCQVKVEPADIFYVPESELSADYLYGPIQEFQEPSWLANMLNYEIEQSDCGRSDVVSAQNGMYNVAVSVPRGGSTSFSGGGKSSPAIDYSEAMLACAKAYYETSLMKDWTFAVTCRLLFQSGGTICPGKVLGVTSGSGEVLGGYITAVEHVISVANKSAHTRIICSHPRFGSLPPQVSSSANALYT